MKVLRGTEAKNALTRTFASAAPSPQELERNRVLYGQPFTPQQAVDHIITNVRERGDEAVQQFAKMLDGLPEAGLEVSRQDMQAARDALDPALLDAIRHAIERLGAFHAAQPSQGFLEHNPEGALGQLLRPVERVGVYAPAGANPLASSVIHTVVPARVAGVEEIVLCSPPGKDGRVDATTLAAALECGVDRVFALGGATAIAAMAFGTQTVPKVDKIGGPGNTYTVLAMRAVFGHVGIVSLPGPTETLVVADESANPRFVAADVLAQAEHAQAEPILVSTSQAILEATWQALELQCATLPEPNQAWARQALETRAKFVLADDLGQALELANHYAPEHLCLLLKDPWAVLGLVRHAGGVFVGEDSMEALGDYCAGPSHVMPTMGTARFSSPVNVRDFQKIISVVGLNRAALLQTALSATRLARAEGLEAHARAIEARLD